MINEAEKRIHPRINVRWPLKVKPETAFYSVKSVDATPLFFDN